MYAYACECTHSGLDNLRAETVGSIGRTDDITNTEPVGSTDDSAEITRILNTVECKIECVRFDNRQRELRFAENSNTALRCTKRGSPFDILERRVGSREMLNESERFGQFGDTFVTFGNKEIEFVAELFDLQ